MGLNRKGGCVLGGGGVLLELYVPKKSSKDAFFYMRARRFQIFLPPRGEEGCI